MIHNKRIIALLTIIAALIFWLTGIIPSFIARVSAENYVKLRYMDKGFEFVNVEIPKSFDNYFVSFKDKSGIQYHFVMSKHIPTDIIYDPLDPPG